MVGQSVGRISLLNGREDDHVLAALLHRVAVEIADTAAAVAATPAEVAVEEDMAVEVAVTATTVTVLDTWRATALTRLGAGVVVLQGGTVVAEVAAVMEVEVVVRWVHGLVTGTVTVSRDHAVRTTHDVVHRPTSVMCNHKSVCHTRLIWFSHL